VNKENLKKLTIAALAGALCLSAQQPVSIQFKAVVGGAELACGKAYPNIGTTKSTITPRVSRAE
jgi:hypothetical protein